MCIASFRCILVLLKSFEKLCYCDTENLIIVIAGPVIQRHESACFNQQINLPKHNRRFQKIYLPLQNDAG